MKILLFMLTLFFSWDSWEISNILFYVQWKVVGWFVVVFFKANLAYFMLSSYWYFFIFNWNVAALTSSLMLTVIFYRNINFLRLHFWVPKASTYKVILYSHTSHLDFIRFDFVLWRWANTYIAGTVPSKLHSLLGITITPITRWHLESVVQNGMKCHGSEHGECGKLKISVQRNILEFGFV